MIGPLNVDFSQTQDFDIIREGNYNAVITDVEVRDSKSSEHPYLNWTLTINGGEYDNRKVWLMTSLSPKALFKLKELIIATGAEKESLKGQIDFDPDDLKGKEVTIKIKHEKYQGETRDRIDAVHAVGSVPVGSKEEIEEAKKARPALASGGADKKAGGRRL